MLLRTVRMTFDPARLGDFLNLFAEARPRIAAAPGCRHLELWQDARFPNVLTTFSQWDDADALEAYRRSELFTTTWAKTTPLFAAAPVAHSQRQVS
ncbi:antibiotic biosynthesis monooxygenase [Rubrivirga sp. SAORIC476]|uniref:putative quinol monooxygenase n=1 Tax=Rubrivirga sp. SAORIC476 TaxID=1961794 RepID=UPI000BA963B4|nr:antibiotic biosynthesis monooxygenase family protein [Rubrivirga sp. SAORIC476]PAP79740.1 antibiotic biosynthesis monooxygenase [Rubrivirga sp. SAORIC476]